MAAFELNLFTVTNCPWIHMYYSQAQIKNMIGMLLKSRSAGPWSRIDQNKKMYEEIIKK